MASESGAADVGGRCTLLAGSFDYLVQVALVAAAVGTLVYKRHIEKPKRAMRVWAFDASKQAYAGVLQHLVNMVFGVMFAEGGASECVWYFVNFTITTFAGIALLYLFMRLWAYAVEKLGWEILRSGQYGDPPSWKPWLAQMLVWGCIASGEKVRRRLHGSRAREPPLLTCAARPGHHGCARDYSTARPARPLCYLDRGTADAVPERGAGAGHGARTHGAQRRLLLGD